MFQLQTLRFYFLSDMLTVEKKLPRVGKKKHLKILKNAAIWSIGYEKRKSETH